jgi:hypothetical protein
MAMWATRFQYVVRPANCNRFWTDIDEVEKADALSRGETSVPAAESTGRFVVHVVAPPTEGRQVALLLLARNIPTLPVSELIR